MCETKSNRNAGALRIEPVDNWHPAWEKVLTAIEQTGKPEKLHIDSDGWLSARQVVTVAFVGDAPAAHVVFSVSPSKDGSIHAKLESHGIAPHFTGRGIEAQIHREATDRASALKCEKLKGFRLNSKWC